MDQNDTLSNSLLSNFSHYPSGISPTTFYELKLKVVHNSNQILQNLSIDLKEFNFSVIDNPRNKEEGKLIENIVYSSIYLYQERLRIDSLVLAFAPIDQSAFFILMQVLTNSITKPGLEILIPCVYNQFWFMFKYKLTFNKKKLHYFQYMGKDEPEYAMIEQVQIQKLLTAKFNNLQIGIKEFFKLSYSFSRKEFLIVPESIFSRVIIIYDADKITWACNLLISACQVSLQTLEEAGQKIQEVFQLTGEKEIKQAIKANSMLIRENEEEVDGICVFCVTWPFFKNKRK